MTTNGRRPQVPEFVGNAYERHFIVSGPKPLRNFNLMQPETREVGMPPVVVPEPGALWLWVVAAICIGAKRWRNR